MEMILLDWTRMGHVYCLAGAVRDNGGYRVVRPLLARHRAAAVRNTGWSPYLFDGRRRWEAFELIGAEPATPEPPHVEDTWVRALRPLNRSAGVAQRYEILTATMTPPGREPFGAPLSFTRAGAFLPPGVGCRSLTTLTVPASCCHFRLANREGAAAPDVRVRINVPVLDGRQLMVKDHHLLSAAERASLDPTARLQAMANAVAGMGGTVAVRLGLSRADDGQQCWLMADGFFSLTDPQP